MQGKIPVCTKCCHCLPLRYGLLAWGYFKLIADALIITLLATSTIWTLNNIPQKDEEIQRRVHQDLIIPVIAFAVFIVDLLVTIVFIVGGHKKNVKKIRIFYYVSIVMWILTFLVTVVSDFMSIESYMLSETVFWVHFFRRFSFHFIALVVQTYFIFLLRSEIIKLNNIGEFRFVNNAAEAECTMKCEDVAARGDTEIEHV